MLATFGVGVGVGVGVAVAGCSNSGRVADSGAPAQTQAAGSGMKGFFYECQVAGPDTTTYWFTISSADQAQIDKLCDPATTYPVGHDEQHATYWIDEPFTCTGKTGPS